MPPRGSKLQKQKSTSDQQSNIDDQLHISESNQKSDSENLLMKQPDGTDSDEAQQQFAVNALTMKSQPNIIIPMNDQEEKSKDFLDTKSKIQELNIDSLVAIMLKQNYVKNQEKAMQNLHRFHSNLDENEAIKIFNILNFFKECLPFSKLCPFLTKEKNDLFCTETQKLLNFNENDDFFRNYFQNVSSFCSDFDNLFGHQFNCMYFRQTFSELTTTLSNLAQANLIKAKNENFDYTNFNESLLIIFIGFKVLMKTQRIRTAISFTDKLIKLKSDFIHNSFNSEIPFDDKISKQFDDLIKLTLHLKMIFIIHQFIEIMNQISSQINEKNRPKPENNEIIDYFENHPDLKIYEIIDEFSFKIKNKTDFLRLANEFVQQLSTDMDIDDFKSVLSELLSRSFSLLDQSFHQCGLNPVLFSLHYHYRMIQAATSSIIPLLRSEPFDQTEYLKNIFIELKLLLKKFSYLEGKEVDLGIINDIRFSLITKFKTACHAENLKSSYKGTSTFQNLFKYIKLFEKDLKTIETTICFAHQVDLFLRELEIIDDESCFNLKCQFYSPKKNKYFKSYSNTRFQNGHTTQADNYDTIISELSSQLHSHGYDMLPENYSQNTFCEISAPNISNAILIMLNYGDYPQIQALIENPNQLGNEDNLFIIINDIYKKVVEFPQNALYLKESISVYIDTYFLLRALDLAGKVDFSNSVHLMYFRTFASIIFKDEFIGKVSLVTPFMPSTHPCYKSIIKRLTNLKDMKQVNDEISHIRLYFYKFAGAIFQLDPAIISSNLKILTRIMQWFSNPTKESNNNFLNSKYLNSVRDLKNFFSTIIKNTRKELDKNTSIYQSLKIIETILDSIVNVQTHYIQFRKTELIIPYLCSFFSCKEEDKHFFQFVSYYPIWLNSIHRCLNYELIKCDKDLLDNSFKSTFTNVIENSEKLINSFEIDYLSFFNDLITCSLKTNNQSITMMIDVIVRGSFSFKNVSKLFSYLLKYYVSLAQPESNDFNEMQTGMSLLTNSKTKTQIFTSQLNYELWRNALKLSCFLIAINTHPYLHKKLNLNPLRFINLKNYINAYINGFLYLHSSALSNLFDKDSSREILNSFKDLQKIITELPICNKIGDSIYHIKMITNIVTSANSYLCEIGPEEGIIGSIESYIRNIQDKTIRKAFKSSLKVALLSGTNSQGSTTLLSKNPTGTPVVASQAAVADGYESIFYSKEEDNYLDDMNDVLEEYLEFDESLKRFIQKNTHYCNSNYFNEDEDDINPNITSCALHKKLIEECLNDESRAENYIKTIDKINILSLYLSIVKETNSFIKFASFDLASYIRITPPFAIYKPTYDKPEPVRNNIITVNISSQSSAANIQQIQQQQQQQQQQQLKQKDDGDKSEPDEDWMKNDFKLFIVCLDDHFQFNSELNSYCPSRMSFKDRIELNQQSIQNRISISNKAKNQAQLQILPFQYSFNDTGVTFTKFRFKDLYNNSEQALKNKVPTPMPQGELAEDQLLPIQIQQTLLDKIDYLRKENKLNYIEILKKQSLDEQKEIQEKQKESTSSSSYTTKVINNNNNNEAPKPQKEPLLLPKVIIKGRDRLIKKDKPKKEIVVHSAGESESNTDDEDGFNASSASLVNRTSLSANSSQRNQFYERKEEEEKLENESMTTANAATAEDDENQNENDESKKVVKTRGRGRPSRKKDKKSPKSPQKSVERTISTPSSSLTITLGNSSSAKYTPLHDTAPATETLSLLKSNMIKLNQLENDEAKRRETNENMSRVQPLVVNTITRLGNEIKNLSKSSNRKIEKRAEYYDVYMNYQDGLNNLAAKKEQFKQSQNISKGLKYSSQIAQKVIDSYNGAKQARSATTTTPPASINNNNGGENQSKLGFSSFNPFILRKKQNKKAKNIEEVDNRNPSIIKTEKEEEQEKNEAEANQEEVEEMSPGQLLSLFGNQIKEITQQKIKQSQQKANDDEIKSQSKVSRASSDHEKVSSQSQEREQNEEQEEQGSELNQADLSANQQNQQLCQNLLSFEDSLNSESIPSELNLFSQETANFSSLPQSLRKLTHPCWACLSKEEIDSNSITDDLNQNQVLTHLFDTNNNNNNNEGNDDDDAADADNNSSGNADRLADQRLLMSAESREKLQQRYRSTKRKIQFYEALSNDLNNGNDDEKIKPSASKQKLSRNSLERSKNDNGNDNNDNQVISDADAEITGDSDVGFGLDGDLGFGFENDNF